MTKLRHLYGLIGVLATETQIHLCRDFERTLEGSKAVAPLVSWFAESFEAMGKHEKITEPFIGPTAKDQRTPLGSTSTSTNRVVYLLEKEGEVRVADAGGQVVYRFRYVEREVPPLRAPGVGKPDSGRGGIDYVALRLSGAREQPCLGEIKVDRDQNAFYAFVQLLTYLSELGTRNQTVRLNEHALFGKDVGADPAFDLHVLLADFPQTGKRASLTNETQELAKTFKEALQKSRPELSALLGDILCLEMDTTRFEETKQLDLRWKV